MLSPEIKNEARRRLAARIFRGESTNSATKKVTENVNDELAANPVNPSILKSEWDKREEWLYDVFNIQEDKILQQILSEQSYIKEELYNLYDDADKISQKRLLLKDVSSLNREFIDLLEEVGIIQKEPDRLELTGANGGALEISALAQAAEEWEEDESSEPSEED